MNAVLKPAGSPLGHAIIDVAFLDDPYPSYARLREAGPIHWSDEFFGGAWLLTRHADVDAVLRDDTRFAAQRTGGWLMRIGEGGRGEGAREELRDFQGLFARAMLFVDGADHARLRAAMNAGFRGDALARLRPFIERWVEDRLDTLEADLGSGDGFDFMATLARPLPAEVIAELMGIAAAERERFIAGSEDLANFIGAPMPTLALARRAQTSLRAMALYFERLTEQRRQNPRDDLVSRLVQAEATGQINAGPELLAQCAMLLFAGHETTRNLFGNGLNALLSHPEQWERLREEPSLLPGAVRELLRYDSPVQYTGRRVITDLVLHGQPLRRGDLVVALIGAANRDPQCFDRADELDITRRAGAALSFGAGPHVCIGAALTMMEGQILFSAMLRRWPSLRLRGGAARWNGNPVYRGLTELPVVGSPGR
jgi:cytochrome P450